ncbi:MAG: hypothetical protein EON58_19345 [Alphaproteobacteria bacterium]|nr:MAG: hypothetical protein EON58_19345 [Alphaproteobacteria bacterium]
MIDATNGSIQRGIVDVDGEFSGCFFEEVEPTGSTITVAVSGGATLSGVTPSTVTWRPRFPGA